MLGAPCRIVGTEFDGKVIGRQEYIGDQNRYAVRYCDFSGPQERWFTAGEISFDGREVEGAFGVAESNVVVMERKVA